MSARAASSSDADGTIYYDRFVNKLGIKDLAVWKARGNGNCLFSSVCMSISPVHWLTPDELRTKVAHQVLSQSDEWFDIAMINYREELARGQFSGGWNPNECKTKEELYSAILIPLQTGDYRHFEGDNIILSLIVKVLGVDAIVLQDGVMGCTRIASGSSTGAAASKWTIFLLFDDKSRHYNALGVIDTDGAEGGINSIFPSDKLPSQLASFLEAVELKGKIHEKQVRDEAKLKSVPQAPAVHSMAMMRVAVPRIVVPLDLHAGSFYVGADSKRRSARIAHATHPVARAACRCKHH
jgi:hypothetical protein